MPKLVLPGVVLARPMKIRSRVAVCVWGIYLMPAALLTKLQVVLDYHNFILQHYHQQNPLDYQQVLELALAWAEELRPLTTDVTQTLHRARLAGSSILYEGAQGSLLDIDHGTYPYVTSSNTTAGGVATGSGVGPLYLDYVLGITKAYTTRVGAGPFPTELLDDIGQHIGTKGGEVGATTGRTRRTGWFDAVAVKHAVQINSISGLCLTKLDVLDEMAEIQVCVGYRDAGGNDIAAPSDAESWAKVQPV